MDGGATSSTALVPLYQTNIDECPVNPHLMHIAGCNIYLFYLLMSVHCVFRRGEACVLQSWHARHQWHATSAGIVPVLPLNVSSKAVRRMLRMQNDLGQFRGNGLGASSTRIA
jgi:hypothetical protein